jgi:PAS domain S-box-containing protein
MNKRNQHIISEEVTFSDSEELVSTTDLRGVITYVNDEFCRVAGYSREELLKKNHNIVRHPEMPKAAFKDMWEHLKQGQAWRGAVKNRCKDGRYYWVDAFVTPIYHNGEQVGYQSVRRKMPADIKERAETTYAKLRNKTPKQLTAFSLGHPLRLSLAGLSALACILASYWGHPLFSVLIPLLFFILMYKELWARPGYERGLKLHYDSISRQIYCRDPSNIADFHLKVNEGRVKTILGRATDSSHDLSLKVQSLESASQHSKHNVEVVSKELENVSSAMEEMVAAVKEVAQNGTQTSEQILHANEQFSVSSQRMSETKLLMEKLAQDVNESSESTNYLAGKITSIQSLMTDITDIAEQTNLLALNAAIEAARAGDLGRGFAVVADEVRKLSQKSHETAEKIQEAMDKVIQATQTLETTMEHSEDATRQTLENMAQTQESVSSLASIMTEIESAAVQTSTATEEQIAVANEINQNINAIYESSQSNLKDAETVNQLSADIEHKSEQLRSLSQSFG